MILSRYSARVRRPARSQRSDSSPPWTGWTCASPKAGMASRPRRSMTRVCGPAWARTSSSPPSALTCPRVTAAAEAKPDGCDGVRIFPLTRTSSAMLMKRDGSRLPPPRRYPSGMTEAGNSRVDDPPRPPAVIYTDGACSGNPGPGGWGAVLRYGDTLRELHGGERATTNNRMELMAVISALEALKRPVPVQLYTDSRYVLDGITKWLPGWKRAGWLTAAKKPVKNVDLWQRLGAAPGPHQGRWRWG